MTKKILTIGSILTLTPVLGLIACGSSNKKLIIISGKTQIQDLGMKLAKQFDKNTLSAIENGAESTQFRTLSGSKISIELAKNKGYLSFPSAFNSNTQEAKVYIDGGHVLSFEDPKYDSNGKATIDGAEDKNIKIAGSKINELIKSLQKNGRDYDIVKYKGKIVGIPSYKESIGIVYNKKVFNSAGLEVVIGTGTSEEIDWSKSILESGTTSSPKKIYTTKLDSLEKYNKLKTLLTSKMGGSKKATGIVTSGKESWAFSSKVAYMGISVGAKEKGLKIRNPLISGDTTIIPSDVLTPKKAKDILFNSSSSEGVKAMKNAALAYIKGANTYTTNSEMMDAFQAGNIAMMPQGTWIESTINKTKGMEYGLLPFTIGHTNAKSIIGTDVTGHWYFANQAKMGRKSSQVVPFQTEAVNFINFQYLETIGNDILQKEMGLANPYKLLQNNIDISKHPLLSDASKYDSTNILKWGNAFNAPGVGSTGFERNNLEWTTILNNYATNSSDDNLKLLVDKMVSIWQAANVS